MALGRRITAVASALLAVAAGSATGQNRTVHMFAHGGGYSAVRDVNRVGTAQFKTGFTLGGGIGYGVSDNLDLQATLTGAQSQLLQNGAATGVYLNRYYVAADLKAGYRAARGITPYGLVGAGAVLLHEKGTTGTNKTQGFVHLGCGVAYAVGKSGLSIFTQGDGWFYSLSEMNSPGFVAFSATQIDVGWTAGASYRLPI